MQQLIESHWIVFAAALVAALLIAIWLLGRATRPSTRVREHRPDVLDEGAAPAQRNQALIDSPMAATIVPPTMVDTMGGMGEIIAAGAHEQAANAEAAAWEREERAVEAGDDLGRMKGVGPKLVAALHGLGVTRYAQIAGWSQADIDRIDAQLGSFAGRIRRDDWVEQATLLASGDTAAYEAKFGKI